MTSKIIAYCPAKLNLTLNVLEALANGYHKIETLFQSISLEDKLIFEFEASSRDEISISCEGTQCKLFPTKPDNLIAAAFALFQDSTIKKRPVKLSVHVIKNIPIGAGLAGGSSNAAATLLALNQYFKHSFNATELLLLAKQLGADVPFCLKGGSCIGTEYGDVLERIEKIPALWAILVKPKNISVPTAWVYHAYDEFIAAHGIDSVPRPKIEDAINSIVSGKFVKSNFQNVFEPIVFNKYPELAELQKFIEASGAIYCRLTGSGPTLYGLTHNEEDALKIKYQLSKNYDTGNFDIFIVSSVDHGARLDLDRIEIK